MFEHVFDPIEHLAVELIEFWQRIKTTEQMEAVTATANNALAEARAAQDTANNAMSLANDASAAAASAQQAADSAQACCNANSDKLDRMFQRAMSK